MAIPYGEQQAFLRTPGGLIYELELKGLSEVQILSPPDIGEYDELELLTFHLPTSKKNVFKVLKRETSIDNSVSYYYYEFYSSSWELIGMYRHSTTDQGNISFKFTHIPYSNFIAIVTSNNKVDFIQLFESTDGKISFQAISFNLLDESNNAIKKIYEI